MSDPWSGVIKAMDTSTKRRVPPPAHTTATVVAVSYSTSPPTCSINLQGDTTQIDGIAVLAGVVPSVGDTVLLARRSNTYVVVGTYTSNPVGFQSTYVPTWTADSGTPSIGNGSMNISYMVLGKLFIGRFDFTYGSTTTPGTAASNWHWTLPNGFVPALDGPLGFGVGNPTSNGSAGTGAFPAQAFGTAGSNIFDMRINGQPLQSTFASVPNGVLDSTTPQTWGTGGVLRSDLMFFIQ